MIQQNLSIARDFIQNRVEYYKSQQYNPETKGEIMLDVNHQILKYFPKPVWLLLPPTTDASAFFSVLSGAITQLEILHTSETHSR